MWRSVCLRSAGFPAHLVLALAAPAVARLADLLDIAEADQANARREAATALLGLRPTAAPELAGRIRVLLTLLKKNRAVAVNDAPAEVAAILARYAAARELAEATSRDLDLALAAAEREADAAIVTAATDPGFLLAVTWQNRKALRHGIGAIARHEGPSDSHHRAKQRLVARYLQRYCLKNESIGAFGPVGWATLTGDGPDANVQPGPQLIERREVYFEGWCIEALCETIGQLPGMRQWIAPRRVPGIWIDGARLRVPMLESLAAAGQLPSFMAEPRPLAAADMAIVEACDGERAVDAIAHHLNRTAADVSEAIERLEASGVLLRRLEVPVDPHAERLLRDRLLRIGDAALRDQATAMLDRLEEARTAVTIAAGDAAAVDRAIDGVESAFTALTGEASTRAEGKTYAARTLLYEDCRRDVRVDLGPGFVAELSAPLGLVLTSARWLTSDVARRYRDAFNAIYRSEAAKAGSEAVSLHVFSMQAQALLGDANAEPLLAAADDLSARWSRVLGDADPGATRRDFRSADLAPLVDELFAAPAPGWALARYVSPDIMVAARGPEAFARGEYQIVLGEVHLANTIGRHALMEQHPDAATLVAGRARDIDIPCVIPVTSATWNVQRNGPALVQPHDVRFAYERPFAGAAGTPVIAIGECIVEEREGALVVRTRDGRAAFDVIEFFGHTLSNQCLSYPRIVPAARHTPRITVDRMVIARESWRLSPADLGFADATTTRDVVRQARQRMRKLGLPRFVFAKIPGEQKPYFVDFESPTYLRMFGMLVASVAGAHGEDCTIGLSEMLPDLDHLWLVDATGAGYTSEFRMVALDAHWPASANRTS